MGEAYIVRRGGGGTGSMSKPPEYTYTGVYKFHDEGDGINWWMELKTAGVLTFQKMNNAKDGIEVFMVGGGGGGGGLEGSGNSGGGGGGYVLSFTFEPEQGKSYTANIGAGGISENNQVAGAGGDTSIFGKIANGGKPSSGSTGAIGGDGGSGGGSTGSNGGTNGSDGEGTTGGKGAGITTIPWGNEALYGRYAGGGGGGIWNADGGKGGAGGGGDGGRNGVNGKAGGVNTGGGGGGTGMNAYGGAGGSGIILIRNKRA